MANNMITNIDDDDDFMNDIDVVCFGSFYANIVGIRYYQGRVNKSEMVALHREPYNRYDANAIRVDNVGGVQVGHIKREQAKILAKIVDNKKATLEGVVPFGVNNKYGMPCIISLFGKEADKGLVTSQMMRAGYPLTEKGLSRSSGFEDPVAFSSNSLLNAVKVSSQAMKKELDNLFIKMATESTIPSSAEPAEAIKTHLFPHQKQALAWMISCENDEKLPPFWEQRGPKDYFNSATNFSSPDKPEIVKGGILADDMGLGKTLEMIALIVTNFKNGENLVTVDKTKPVVHDSAGKLQNKGRKKGRKRKSAETVSNILDDDEENDEDMPELPSFTAKEDPEFVIPDCQLIADTSDGEKVRYPKRSSKRPVRYTIDDNADENMIIEEVSAEMELTTVNGSDLPVIETVEIESVTEPTPNETVAESVQIGTTVASKIGESHSTESFKGKRVKAAGARATLIICPLSVLQNWQDQISLHVWNGILDVCTYHGADRIKDSEVLAKKDVVLTTYQTLSVEFSKKNSPLVSTKWLRVVLDEGHCIRNPNAMQTKAVRALNAERRWIVTGTPIQNSMKDLWSLVCFLRLDPFKDKQWWTRVMERPIKDGDKSALIRLQQLMKRIALRRTKTQKVNGKPIVDLPSRNVYINYIELSNEERDIYQAVAEKGKVTIGKYLKAGTLLANYAEVLAILTRLRQLCCHPKLCTAALEAAAKEAAENSTPDELRKKLTSIITMVLSADVDEECPICIDAFQFPVITHCAHIYCKKCIENVINTSYGSEASCPLCRRPISSDKLVDAPSDQQDESFNDCQWYSSAKVDSLMAALEEQRKAEPLVKCLVVSQFTSFLKLIKNPLESRGFNYVTLDGSMTQEKRAAAIRAFSDDKPNSPNIFLLSLKAGGVGLNLSAATKVFLLDPAWNPAVEEQCFDRCHRLGQTKEVNIYKFVIKNSVEEKMLELQDKKRGLMMGAFEKKSGQERRKQVIRDVTNLMNVNS